MKKKDNKYAEDYKSPEWQKKRLQILERDNWTCQHCGARDIQLHIHHTVYAPGYKLWEYPDDSLITLCKDCHELAHIDRNEIVEVDYFVRQQVSHNFDVTEIWRIAFRAIKEGWSIGELRNHFIETHRHYRDPEKFFDDAIIGKDTQVFNYRRSMQIKDDNSSKTIDNSFIFHTFWMNFLYDFVSDEDFKGFMAALCQWADGKELSPRNNSFIESNEDLRYAFQFVTGQIDAETYWPAFREWRNNKNGEG